MLVIFDNLKVIIVVTKWLGFLLSKILEKEKVLKNTKNLYYLIKLIRLCNIVKVLACTTS